MKPERICRLLLVSALATLTSCTTSSDEHPTQPVVKSAATQMAQVPTWSREDLNFFLHGSMSSEIVPETVLRAFIAAYPDLFPSKDFSHLGAIPDPQFGWPVGFTRGKPAHLGGVTSVGVNCASCHVGEITAPDGGAPVRVLGMTAQFDVEGFFGAVIVSTFRSADAANMEKFLAAYLAANDPAAGNPARELFAKEWARQKEKTQLAMLGFAMKKSADVLQPIQGGDLQLDAKSLARGQDLSALSVSLLKLFHNLRFALHVPDQPPPALPPNGPGRNDPWRLLAYSLVGVATEPAPVKFGIVWNQDQRVWVHDDGNTGSSIVRNLAASLGLGAPLLGHRGVLDFAALQRHTAISQVIRPPRYPWPIDHEAAGRGAKTFSANCASCHDGPQDDKRLHAIAEVGTDPNRAKIFTPQVADLFNKFFAELQIPGYNPTPLPLRSTQQYWSPSLAGVWARSPYLHNGSVRTMADLLTPPAARAKSFHRGSHVFDAAQMGYADEGTYLLETTGVGNSNSGHDYGTDLPSEQKRDLIEFLKTL